mmetsp:Transcript_19757/g.55825  ORF Transcript_19757/g.55825 Transcript_19757/m.55825 type:complete len:258 (+) Transcript_19757:1435-2208(+)
MRIRVAHVRRMPRGRPRCQLASRRRRSRQRRCGRSRCLLAHPQAIPSSHRGIRRHPRGHVVDRQRCLDQHCRHGPHERDHRQPRGTHGHFVHHEAELHRTRPSHRRARHGHRRRIRHLPRRHELHWQFLHEHANRHHGRRCQHHDAVLPNHRTRPDEMPSAHVGSHLGVADATGKGGRGRQDLPQPILQGRASRALQLWPILDSRRDILLHDRHALEECLQGRRQVAQVPRGPAQAPFGQLCVDGRSVLHSRRSVEI